MTEYEKLEFEVLQIAGVPVVPPAWDGEQMWLTAIAKIYTFTGRKSFALVRNNCTDHPDIIRTFTSGGVGHIESIHPTRLVDPQYIPAMTKTQKRAYVSKEYGVLKAEVDSLDDAAVQRLFMKVCIRHQMDAEAEREEARKRIEKARQERENLEKGILPQEEGEAPKEEAIDLED